MGDFKGGIITASWKSGTVPAEHAIRGVHTVTLSEDGYERTAKLLTETLGFRLLGEERGLIADQRLARDLSRILDVGLLIEPAEENPQRVAVAFDRARRPVERGTARGLYVASCSH